MKTNSIKKTVYLVSALFFALTSCKAPQSLTVEKLKPISTNRLVKNVEDNIFNYKGLDIKKISCQYETPENKTSFKATLKSAKDEYILLTLSKLNITAGKLLLTPDSIKMVNYVDKSYLLKDYSFLTKFLGADIDFYMLQAILTSNVFNLRENNDENDYKEYESYSDSGMYVLQSLNNRKLGKITKKGKDEKVDRYLKKFEDEDFIAQYLYVDPKTFKIRKIILDDITNNRKVNVDFSEFEQIEKQLYPGNINIHFSSLENDLKLNISLSKFSTEYEPVPVFNIPEKYEMMKK